MHVEHEMMILGFNMSQACNDGFMAWFYVKHELLFQAWLIKLIDILEILSLIN